MPGNRVISMSQGNSPTLSNDKRSIPGKNAAAAKAPVPLTDRRISRPPVAKPPKPPRIRKKVPLFVKLVIGLLIVTVALVSTVAVLWLKGRSTMMQLNAEPTFAAPKDDSTEEVPVAAKINDSDESTVISYKGKYYRYNEEITNILLIGVDGGSPEKDQEVHQSDLLVLAALDHANNKISLVNIPRDAMCDIEITNEDGSSAGTATTQIALSYAYGKNEVECAEMCRNAVSSVFCGLPINGYGAFYMDGIPALNDALGGVTVKILDDYPFKDMPAGQEMKLTGEQAKRYMKSRLSNRVDASLLRLARQKQYLLAMIDQAGAKIREQPSRIVPLYRALEDYISTDLSISSISYLASVGALMDFSNDVRTLDGEMILSEDGMHAEYILDQSALYDTMLDVFYTETDR